MVRLILDVWYVQMNNVDKDDAFQDCMLVDNENFDESFLFADDDCCGLRRLAQDP